MMLRHEATDSSHGRILAEASYLAIAFDAVVLERLQRDGFVHALNLFGLGVHLLFSLFASATKPKNQMQRRFLLDIVIGQSATVFQLLTGKDQSLLIGWDALLVLDLRLDVVNGIARFNIESDGLTRQCFDKYLHGCCFVLTFWGSMVFSLYLFDLAYLFIYFPKSSLA